MGCNLWLHGDDGVSALEKDDKVIFPEQGEEKLTKIEPQVNTSERKLSIKTDPEEFKKFHALLTRDRPNYQPFYFPLNPNSKDPMDNKSWKANRITVEQAAKYLEMGYNIGIAATDTDILVLMDADDLEKVGAFKPTLTVISRKRIGKHGYYFTKDKPQKISSMIQQNRTLQQKTMVRSVLSGSMWYVQVPMFPSTPRNSNAFQRWTEQTQDATPSVMSCLSTRSHSVNSLRSTKTVCLRKDRQR